VVNPASVTPVDALRGQHGNQKERQLLTKPAMDVRDLGEKHRGHRDVNICSDQVKAVPR
jgi:hypothetical protein